MKLLPTEQNKPQRPLRGQTDHIYQPSGTDKNKTYLTELKRLLDKQDMDTAIDNTIYKKRQKSQLCLHIRRRIKSAKPLFCSIIFILL